MAEVAEALVVASVSVVPGTAAQPLAQRLADGVVELPAPPAAVIAAVDVPADVAVQVRGFAESQEMAEAAADDLVMVARIYYRPAAELPRDPVEVAVAARKAWQQHVAGVRTGLIGVSVIPAIDPDRWLQAASRTPWIVATRGAQPGLLPELS
jgi:hypothetical protein